MTFLGHKEVLSSPFNLGDVNPAIELLRGPGLLSRREDLLQLPEVTITHYFRPSPVLHFEGMGGIEADSLQFMRPVMRWGADQLAFPELDLKAPLYREATTIGFDLRTWPAKVKAKGHIRSATSSRKPRLIRLLFHVANLPEFIGEPVADEKAFRASSCQLFGGPWQVRLDGRINFPVLQEELSRIGGYAITHIGELKRCSGATFTAGEAIKMIEALHWFLSFARGSWTGPMMCVGDLAQGGTWRYFRNPNIDPWLGSHSWCDQDSWMKAANVFPEYFRLWSDPVWNQGLKNVIAFYVSANRPKPLELALTSAHAGLELLGWLRLVHSGSLKESDWKNHYPAARKVRELLELDEIDPEIPPVYPGLRRLNPKWKDGPAVIAGIRNQLAHPRVQKENKNQKYRNLLHSWLLARSYLEQSLLGLLGPSDSLLAKRREP